jgi:hypothetical protein
MVIIESIKRIYILHIPNIERQLTCKFVHTITITRTRKKGVEITSNPTDLLRGNYIFLLTLRVMQEEAQRAKNEAKAGETKAEEGASVQPSEYSATAKQVIRACSSLFNNGGLEELTAPFSEVASVPRKALIKLNFLHLW